MKRIPKQCFDKLMMEIAVEMDCGVGDIRLAITDFCKGWKPSEVGVLLQGIDEVLDNSSFDWMEECMVYFRDTEDARQWLADIRSLVANVAAGSSIWAPEMFKNKTVQKREPKKKGRHRRK